MGNFLRRFTAFILGMVFGFVLLAGSIVGVGYFAYKNGSLNSLGVTEDKVDLGELNNATFEELIALLVSATKDPSSYTLGDLEREYGLDVEGFLTSMGMDLTAIHPDDVISVKKLSPFALGKENGFNEFLKSVNMGVLFGFIPKIEGVYPVLSEGARAKLRAYSVADLITADASGNLKLLSVLGELPLGSILSSAFVENYDSATATYTYSAKEGGVLDSLGSISASSFITMGDDIGYAVNEGTLADLGTLSFGDLLGITDDGSSIMQILRSKTIADLFVKNGDKYMFDVMGLLSTVKVGDLMGATYCDGTACKFEHTHVEGWYDGSGNIVTSKDIAGELMLKLYALTIESLTNGTFDVTNLTSGIYLGKALGYTIGESAGYCEEDCEDAHHDESCDANCEKIHAHNYYWVDSSNKYVGAMNNSLSNISVDAVMTGSLDILQTLGNIKIGDFMGMTYCNGTSCAIEHTHVEGWYDNSNALVTGSDIASELMLKLYAISVSDLLGGGFDIANLTEGIYLGKALGYKIAFKTGYCNENCDTQHTHNYYWVDSADAYVGALNNAISNISLQDAMNGNLNIEATLGGVKVGDLMGLERKDDGWYNGGVKVTNETIADDIMLGLYDYTVQDLMNGNLDITGLTEGVYLGKALGYTIGESAGYCNESCTISHSHTFYWVDSANAYVGALNNAISNVCLQDAMNGSLDFEGIIGDIKVGELMGYELKADGWYNGSTLISGDTVADEIMVGLYDYTVKDLMNGNLDITGLTEGVYLGKALGYTIGESAGYCNESCTISHSHNYYWVDSANAYVGALNNAISNICLQDAMNGSLDIESAISSVKVGELMGYELKGGSWYNGSTLITGETIADEIMVGIYSYTVGDLMNGSLDLTSLTSGIYLGKALGYQIASKTGYCNENCATNHAHNYYWVDSTNAYVGALNNTISNICLQDAMNGNLDIEGAISSVKVGELMGYELKGGSWYNGATLITGETIADEIMIGIYNYSVGDLMNGNLDIANLTSGIYLGKALGYTIKTQTGYCEVDCAISHAHDFYWVDGSNVYVGKMNNAIANIPLKSAMEGSLNIENVIGALKLGELMGKDFNASENAWYEGGNKIVYANLTGTEKIIYNLYGQNVSSLMQGNFDLTSALNSLYVGELMNFKGGVGAWTKGDSNTAVTSVEGVIADIKMSEMLSGNVDFSSKINNLALGDIIDVSSSKVLSSLKDTKICNISTAIDELYIGQIMGYEKKADGWYNGSEKVTGIYATISNYTIKSLGEGGLADLSIGDVIDTEGNALLTLIKNSKLTTVSTDVNALYLGQVMGYEEETDGWYNGGVKVTGVNGKIANYTIKDVADGKLGGSEFVNSLTLGDVLDASSGIFALMYLGEFTENGVTYSAISSANDALISEISPRIIKGVTNAKYNQLKSAGITLFSAENETKINALYTLKGEPNWRETKSINDIISDIVSASL